LPETTDTRHTVSDEPQLGEFQGDEHRGTATQEASGIAVPESMLEPAQALEAATGLDVAPAANSVATVNIQQNIIVTQGRNGPGFFTRAIWYLFVGWWLTGLAIGFAIVCSISVILLPLSYFIVSKIPTILTLRPRSLESEVKVGPDGTVHVSVGGAKQQPFWQRALWFLFVGWWACALAMTVAYFLSLTIILIPVGLMIFNRVPAVMTLQRN
jgi:uncharacterized membrane protein YccF (DUF307 family)